MIKFFSKLRNEVLQICHCVKYKLCVPRFRNCTNKQTNFESKTFIRWVIFNQFIFRIYQFKTGIVMSEQGSVEDDVMDNNVSEWQKGFFKDCYLGYCKYCHKGCHIMLGHEVCIQNSFLVKCMFPSFKANFQNIPL